MLLLRNDRPDWVRVLEILYQNQITVTKPSQQIPEIRPEMTETLIEKTDLESQEILDALRYLYSADLVLMRTDGSEKDIDAYGGLTNEGLQLAHQIKTERQRRNTNTILLVLTAILTVLTVVLVIAELGII